MPGPSKGTTINMGAIGQLGVLTSANFNADANKVDVTDLSDPVHVYMAGTPDIALNIELNEVNAALAVGQIGEVTVNYSNGQVRNLGLMMIDTLDENAALDDPLASSIAFVPAHAA